MVLGAHDLEMGVSFMQMVPTCVRMGLPLSQLWEFSIQQSKLGESEIPKEWERQNSLLPSTRVLQHNNELQFTLCFLSLVRQQLFWYSQTPLANPDEGKWKGDFMASFTLVFPTGYQGSIKNNLFCSTEIW